MTNQLIPLSQPASFLARFCEQLDANETSDKPQPITELSKALFAHMRLELARSVDEHIKFYRGVKGLIAGYKDAENYWRNRRKDVEETFETFKVAVRDTIKEQPDIPYNGKLGSLSLRNNGGKARLVTSFLIREEKVISNVINPQDIDIFGIDQDFVETVTVTRLNTEKVREALKHNSLSWAELERNVHVTGW